MQIIENITYLEITYFIVMIIFAFIFGKKGILQSLGYTLKIVSSITIPFISYKKLLILIGHYSQDNNFLSSLILKYTLASEIFIFLFLFLITYSLFGVIEKILNLNFKKNSLVKIIDFILGIFYGVFLFSIIFYFAFNLFLKNHISDNMHKIMIYNISV